MKCEKMLQDEPKTTCASHDFVFSAGKAYKKLLQKLGHNPKKSWLNFCHSHSDGGRGRVGFWGRDFGGLRERDLRVDEAAQHADV